VTARVGTAGDRYKGVKHRPTFRKNYLLPAIDLEWPMGIATKGLQVNEYNKKKYLFEMERPAVYCGSLCGLKEQ
jgi:hypothetical protein